ncbi:MAG: indole-3-glycerol phosphate synthase TrpC [Deltaproteobacteria bacterium]|nr:indole-3-glycerol phosphate synthase TrpC [Deltaproteobacteria bacterium]
MILDRIVAEKREEVARLKRETPPAELAARVRDLPPVRPFGEALSGKDCAIVAEIKGRSPSRGVLKAVFDPPKIAAVYGSGGAAALSVLTDGPFFGGDKAHVAAVRKVVSLTVLRKDFIIDACQVYETRLIGTDAMLLIARLLEGSQIEEYLQLALSLDLDTLVEVHDRPDLEKALAAGAGIVGINNRDLGTFATDLKVTLDLLPSIPEGPIVVSESGIRTRGDIETLSAAGVRAFLIGETLMAAADAGAKLREPMGGKGTGSP